MAHQMLTEVFPGIVSDLRIHQGALVIAGTRIQATLIAELANSGETFVEINADYGLNAAQVQAAIDYVWYEL